ncbi:metal ABC transporter substrate-binding protein [Clostridium boliviensis]|uniref:Metal ABC transporter substrate-binding protein n=1 Tax=Clostridium boliviensis TaxID=318465 RepID=A0ABU4GI87_9CLOT|nr:metal ABC transporter substrate-binding protein [Clostridium boliviensis]MDW2797328.1 metal ABC transporter substrate-binding protein [Clostridium boliviensis]
MNKKNIMKAVFFTAAVSAALLSGCGQKNEAQDSGKLTAMASFYPMYDFAVKIGGDKVDVTNMVPAGTEPHDWEPATKDITNLEKADVFVYSGAGMEHWAEAVLKTLKNKNLTVAEASSGITLMKGHEHEEGESQEAESEEHEHGEFDPHVWLSPVNAKKEMENIKDAFVKADPENEAYYQANYETYAGKFDELDKKFKDTLSPLPNKSVVVAHEAFGYLCDAYGLTQMGIEGLTPDSEPDPARMAEVIDFVKENKVKTIFFEDLVSPKVAETIAKETGAKTEVLNPLEGLTDEQLKNGDDYFSVMEKNLTVLKEALE